MKTDRGNLTRSDRGGAVTLGGPALNSRSPLSTGPTSAAHKLRDNVIAEIGGAHVPAHVQFLIQNCTVSGNRHDAYRELENAQMWIAKALKAMR